MEERRERLERFVRYRRDHLQGDEKGEAQVFLERLFAALGHEGVFEAGATLEQRVPRRDRGGTAFADLVWKPRVLIEMKKAREDLGRHYRQAFEYWIDLVPDRPKFVVLCNFDEFWVYDLNEQLDEPVDRVSLDDLPQRWEALAFLFPFEERPTFRNDLVAVTRESAAVVSGAVNRLIERGIERGGAQRFVLQAVMAMFAEDIGLLPRHLFTQVVEDSLSGGSAYDLIFGLFDQMNAAGVTPAGRYEGTPYFNGGLFREIPRFELEREEIEQLHDACQPDWSHVRPAIFGTLFEQSMEAGERHAYGAHFTSEVDIQKVVLPTIVRPWRERIEAAGTIAELGQLENELLQYRVLDPACGCGNFLYVAYRELRRLERQLQERVMERRRREGVSGEMQLSFISTTQFHGLDINAFAVEVAKVTMMLGRKLAADELGDEPSVLPLDDLDGNFQNADSLEVEWPAFDACVSNPPYLGRQRLTDERGPAYVAHLDAEFPGVRGFSDYVVYWFRRAHDLMPERGQAGFVATNTIRQGATREASLDYIVDNGGVIHEAVSSQPWSGDATVDVSIVNWSKGEDPTPATLWLADGSIKLEVERITGSLSAEIDLREARPLAVNRRPKQTFQGQTPGHEAFVLSPEQAHEVIRRDPTSAEVIHPYMIGQELNDTGLPARFIIDIPVDDLAAAGRWPGALDLIRQQVLPARERAAAEEERENEIKREANPNARLNQHHRNFLRRWWQHSYRRGEMIEAISQLPRYIAISRVAVQTRQSVYAFISPEIRPGDAMQVFALSDDYSFGILHSSYHRAWFEQRCSTLRRDLRYTAKTVFDTFPWPQAPTDESVAVVVDVVAELFAYRQERLAEGITLGDQYASLRDPGQNHLRDLHERLDEAVRLVYGFAAEEDALTQLLALNESIALESEEGTTEPRAPGDQGLAGTQVTEARIAPGIVL